MVKYYIQVDPTHKLCYREYGDIKNGCPIIFFHGGFQSRLMQPGNGQTQAISKDKGVHIIAIDRPGYGETDFVDDATLSKPLPQWIEILADELGLKKFGLCAYSFGGPNALATAEYLGDRVSFVGLISSDGPYYEMPWSELPWGHIMTRTLFCYSPSWFMKFVEMLVFSPYIKDSLNDLQWNALESKYKRAKPAGKRDCLMNDVKEAQKQDG
eukprot:UN31411